MANRLKGPEGALFLGDAGAFPDLGWLRACGLRSAGNPFFNQRHVLARELLLPLRHLAAIDKFEERTAIGFAWHKHRPVLAALENQPAQAQVEPASEFFTLAMAVETVRLENRPDVFFKTRGGCA